MDQPKFICTRKETTKISYEVGKLKEENKNIKICLAKTKQKRCAWLSPEIKRCMNNRYKALHKFRNPKQIKIRMTTKKFKIYARTEFKNQEALTTRIFKSKTEKILKHFGKHSIFPSLKGTIKSRGASISSLKWNSLEVVEVHQK